MENNNEVTITKIPIKPILDILQDAWGRGADYFDLVGVVGDTQDNLMVIIKDEYTSDVDDESPEEGDEDSSIDLTDDNLNELI
jgi:hypothetical protein